MSANIIIDLNTIWLWCKNKNPFKKPIELPKKVQKYYYHVPEQVSILSNDVVIIAKNYVLQLDTISDELYQKWKGNMSDKDIKDKIEWAFQRKSFRYPVWVDEEK